ncbi:alpha/beta hydrolase family protein [Amycolatopsis anabasis]|uniref:alpha/beta hydrolase family protein n=1 Tax=Amycolatopsis anabasis TaxID=1840409 RepID=UPI00131C45F5|nr:hypothetical protein [Amycolatopsis anabasis]
MGDFGVIGRRAVLVGTAAAAAGAAIGVPALAAPGTGVPARVDLPRPTGPHAVGTRALHLVDRDRADPWYPDRRREVMVQLWYPSWPLPGAPKAGYLPLSVARLYLAQFDLGDLPEDVFTRLRGHAVDCAPPAPGPRGRPLVLLSHGHGQYRTALTGLAEELASRGMVVASIDHPSDAVGVEFPDGRVTPYREPGEGEIPRYLDTRTEDSVFVLDQLLGPDSELRGRIDPSRVGMFGHSLGGATAAEVMRVDPRVRVGANLDGSQFGRVVETGLDRPFLLWQMSAIPGGMPGWAQLWAGLRGWRRHLLLDRAGHMTCTDLTALIDPLELARRLPPEDFAFGFGSLPGGYSLEVNRAYVSALFTRHLLNRPDPLLEGPSRRFPEVSFVGR